ncbi:C-Myc-binding protein homolog [Chenopodium quinoa]|uniref:c-Myc-binding protein homolog n=1 Tax=Chenopodium quinoa TaxID=63459 RepID=A0A803KPW0_CHEQI|nr:C-Myc-binding protein homolog [Chenopodium quinoa]
MMEKEAKKEAFRKYLESSGAIDSLTKVLVALYEQDNKPSSAIEFVQQKLGGPTVAEYEKLQAEMSELQVKYKELLATHQETCKQLEQYKISSTITTSEETIEDKSQKVNHEDDNEEAVH